MTLYDFFELLSLTEFSQDRLGRVDTAGSLTDPHLLIPIINSGLTELHSRFLIKKGVVHICLDPCIRRYCIDDCKRPYLIYEDCPLRLLEILEVIACDGRQTRLNASHRIVPHPCQNSGSMVDIFMVSPNELEFSVLEGQFRINYRRNASPIPNPKHIVEWDARSILVDIPDAYINALCYYTAMRAFTITTPYDGNAAALSPAIQYKTKYDEECLKLTQFNFELEGMGNYQQRFNETGMP